MSALLTTYLQDHHAGSAAGLDLFRRVASSHGDPEVRAAVGRLADEIAEDQADLERIMESVGATASALKDVPARAGEFLARLKPNERLTSRSPLSDVLELEALTIAVHGKSQGWALLQELGDERIDASVLAKLAQRAERQLAELEGLRRAQAPKLRQE